MRSAMCRRRCRSTLDDRAQVAADCDHLRRATSRLGTLALGFLHGLGADHLMAIAALSVGARGGDRRRVQRARALGVAVRFAIGHALLLALGAGALIVLGWSLPVVFERGGEMLGGMLLIVLGGDRAVGRRCRTRSTATPIAHGHEPARALAPAHRPPRSPPARHRRTRTCRRSSAPRSRSAACAR